MIQKSTADKNVEQEQNADPEYTSSASWRVAKAACNATLARGHKQVAGHTVSAALGMTYLESGKSAINSKISNNFAACLLPPGIVIKAVRWYLSFE